jgi:thiol-disulfide isomerase/thioredoxin
MRKIIVISAVVLTGTWLVLGTADIAQNPSSVAKSTNTRQPSQAILTITPPCPNMGMDARRQYTQTEPAVVRYNPAAPGAALRSPTALTLHVVVVPMGGKPVAKDLAMERQTDDTWTVSITLTSMETGSGYIMFDVEDQAHRFDRNHGDYWDAFVCQNNMKWAFATTEKASTYDGHVIAPGFQRPPDLARALSIMREDFAANPQSFNELFSIWSYETKGGGSRGSDADWAQVSRELDDAVVKYGTTYGFFMQILGFVAPNQEHIDPAVIARLRAAIIASPQAVQPVQWDNGVERQVPRTKRWDDGMAQDVNYYLSQLDLPLAQHIANPAARGAALEEFTIKYTNCEPNCMFVGRAYLSGLLAYGEAGDLDGAKRVAEEWMAWDPKNPDPPAALAQAYQTANKRLQEALELTNRAAQMYQPFANTVTVSSNDRSPAAHAFRSIRSQTYLVVAPFANSKGRIELLRGKIEVAMGDWAAAAKDLQVGLDALAQNPNMVTQVIDAAFALGGTYEHTGDREAALKAYLSAASEPYQKDSGPHDAFVRLFVAMGKGTAQQAEDTLLTTVKERQTTSEAAYVPVQLYQALPKLELTDLSGKVVPLGRPGRAVVVDIWATWCSACALELPSLLVFQKSHPEVDVHAVDVADKPETIRKFLTSKHLTGLHVALTKEYPKGFAQNYPTTFVVSSKHEIAFLHSGIPNDIGVELGADIASLNP